MDAVRVPEVPVIVTVLLAKAAVLLAVSVNIDVDVVEAGDQVAVTPAGRPVAVRLTRPVNPNCGVMETKFVTVPPCATVMLGDAERVNPAA